MISYGILRNLAAQPPLFAPTGYILSVRGNGFRGTAELISYKRSGIFVYMPLSISWGSPQSSGHTISVGLVIRAVGAHRCSLTYISVKRIN